jgi:hypothetical protein
LKAGAGEVSDQVECGHSSPLTDGGRDEVRSTHPGNPVGKGNFGLLSF